MDRILYLNDVQEYTDNSAFDTFEQVTSINQFSDVYPTDWTYQALSNLIERYGCVAGYSNGTYRGNTAMTRFEAAALLNACLDRVTEVTDEVKMLMKEFEQELSILKGRVDGLEDKVGVLEAQQFSTTTKLKGQAVFVTGAVNADGNSTNNKTFINGGGANAYDQEFGALTFNYDIKLFLDTSFTGKDLLRTILRAGNFQSSVFGSGNNSLTRWGKTTALTTLEVAFQEQSEPNDVSISRIFYQFPIGENLTATFGGLVRQDDMLAVWPSAYPNDSILDLFSYAGSPGAYNKNLGSGAGLSWASNGWSVSANYVSGNGNNSAQIQAPNPPSEKQSYCERAPSGGIGTACASSSGTVQVAYTADQWGLAAAYNYSSGNNAAGITLSNGTEFAYDLARIGPVNSVGLGGYWMPQNSGLIPSISAGWGLTSSFDWNGNSKNKPTVLSFFSTYDQAVDSYTSQSWYVGLKWSDVFLKGNSAGMAVGQSTFVTAVDFSNSETSDFVNDGNYAWEWWYQFQVTDSISVTPALFYLSRPKGQITSELSGGKNSNDQDHRLSLLGGLVKTTFRF